MVTKMRDPTFQDALIVFVVEGVDLNAMDQRMVEYEMINCTYQPINVVRYTLKECDEKLKLDEQRGMKLIDQHSQ